MKRWNRFHACMKKSSLAFVLFSALLAPSQAVLAQIPVTDGASITQSITNTLQQIEQLHAQIEQMKQQYEAVTGSYGRGVQGLEEAISAVKNIPGSWQDIVSRQASGEFGRLAQKYEETLKPLSQDDFPETSQRVGGAYQMSSDAVIASFAGAEVLHEEIQTHLSNLESLARQIDTTTNIKDAQDLQNRITAEQALVQTAMGNMGTIQMNLQGTLLNQQLQAEAETKEFYKWKGPGRLFEGKYE